MMIIPPEDSPKSSDLKMMALRSEDIDHDDQPPPSYTSRIDPSEPSAGVSSPPVTFKTKPTNHLAIAHEHVSIKGEFVIDPSLQLPSSLLPPLRDGKTEADRKNLCLSSRFGAIYADIWLLRGGGLRDTGLGQHRPCRTTIDLTSDHGTINAQLRCLDGAAPFVMSACALHGSVKITLPRSFRGLLSLSTRHGSVRLTDTVMRNATQLGQVDDTRRYFVGDLQSFGDGEWSGDEVVITATHGRIRIEYVDEALEDQRKGGLFSRLFGR